MKVTYKNRKGKQCNPIFLQDKTLATLNAALLSAVIGLFPNHVFAGPVGGSIVGGSGAISRNGATTTVNQNTDLMAIDWQSYNINADERVHYIQPDSSSVSLNRILSNHGSGIHGRIDANGQVILVNPHGVVFGDSATINVGGILASGLNIEPTDFMNSDFTFSALANAEGKVINSGLINAATGGSVILLGKQVENNGLIVANLGAVNLAAGKEAILTFDSDGLMGVRVTKEVLQDELGVDAAVVNSGSITAESGRILLTGSVSEDIFTQAVNLGDRATSVVVHEDGSFTLGAGADVVNTGTLEVSTNVPEQNAGQVIVVGENISSSGDILAEGSNGNIELHSVTTTLVSHDSVISVDAVGNGQAGGIKILGHNIGLVDEATITSSGIYGGGEILIGGDETGHNNRVRNAQFIFLGRDTNIYTDAHVEGNGGRIITFAEDTARIYGGLFARGGTGGGNGGFIETSGLAGLDVVSVPNASARFADGKGGEWLIDPYDITIGDAGTGTLPDDNPAVFESLENNTTISVGTILLALSGDDSLDSGNDVTIRTGGSTQDQDGNITLASTLSTNPRFNTSQTLTLEAHNNINLNANINATDGAGALNLVLTANYNNSGTGSIFTQNGVEIHTDGGSVTMHGNEISAGLINTNGRNNRAGGAIELTARNGGITTGPLSANGGNGARSNNNLNGGTGQNGGDITLTANNGSISVNGNIESRGGSGRYGWNNANEQGRPGGDGGAVRIESSGCVSDCISIGSIITNGGRASGDDSDDPAFGGNAGNVTLEAEGDFTLANLIEAVGGNGVGDDAVTELLQAPRGRGGIGGTVTITGGGIVLNGDIVANGGKGGLEGEGANDNDNVRSDENGGASGGDAGRIEVSGASVAINGLLQAAGGDSVRYRSGTGISTGDGGNGGTLTLTGQELVELNNNFDVSGGALPDNPSNGSEAGDEGSLEIYLSGDNAQATIGHSDFSHGFSVFGFVRDEDGNIIAQGLNQALQAPTLGFAANDWQLTGAHTGTLNTDIYFEGVEILLGPVSLDNLTGPAIDNGTVRWETQIGNSGEEGYQPGRIYIPGDAPENDIELVRFSAMDWLTGTNDNDIDIFHIRSNSHGYTIGAANSNSEIIGPNTSNVWWITDAAGGTIATDDDPTTAPFIEFENIANVVGGQDQDTFILNTPSYQSVIDGGGGDDSIVLGPETSGVRIEVGGTGAPQADIQTVGIIDIESVFGRGRTFDILTAAGSGNNRWTAFADNNQPDVNGENDGILYYNIPEGGAENDAANIIRFYDVPNLVGGEGNDAFTLEANAALTGDIHGGNGGGNSLTSDGTSRWALDDDNAFAGTLDRTSADDINDVIEFSNIQTLEGQGGAQELSARRQDNHWQITGADSGTVSQWLDDDNATAEDVISFLGMDSITGNSESDIFVFGESGSLSGTLTGGTGDDTVYGKNNNSTWTINGGNFEVALTDDSDSDPYINQITGIEELFGGSAADIFKVVGIPVSLDVRMVDGGDGQDTIDLSDSTVAIPIFLYSGQTGGVSIFNVENFIGNNTDSALWGYRPGNDITLEWNITGQNDGAVSYRQILDGDDTETVFTTTFENFPHLYGHDGVDDFIFDTAGTIGSINGEGGLNSLTGRDVGSTFFIGRTGNQISRYVAVTGSETYVNAFTDIQTLIGGNGTDIFDASQLNQDMNIGLSDDADGSDFTLAGIENIRANPARDNSIHGSSAAGNDWLLDRQYGGSVGGLNFFGFHTLYAGDGGDTFIVGMAAENPVDSNTSMNMDRSRIEGGEGSDTIQIAAEMHTSYQGAYWYLEENNRSLTMTYQGETETDPDTGAETSAIVIERIQFDGVESLVGNSAPDEFHITMDTPDININGAQGNNDTVSFGPNIFGVDVFLGGSDFIEGTGVTGLGIDNINNITLTTTGNTLHGFQAGSSWTVNNPNAGTVTSGSQTIGFAGFQSLVGSDTNDDNFYFEILGSISSIDGYRGTNTITGRNTTDTWNLNDTNSITANTNIYLQNFTNIQTLNGSAGDIFILGENASFAGTINNGAELRATNTENIWTINSASTGGLNYDLASLDFQNISLLSGGVHLDTIIFNTSSYAGDINAGEGASLDIVDISNLDAMDAIYIGGDVFGVTSAEVIVGGGGSLTGPASGISNWEIGSFNLFDGVGSYAAMEDGVNDGQIQNASSSLYFIDFASLAGGTNASDQFTINNNGTWTGVIKGGGGTNTLVGNNTDNQWVLTGARGGEINGLSFQNIHTLQGGNGTDTLTGRNQNNYWFIDGTDQGTVVQDVDSPVDLLRFERMENLTGGTGDDRFVFDSSSGISGVIDGGAHNQGDVFNAQAIAGPLTYSMDPDTNASFRFINIEDISVSPAVPGNMGLYNTLLGDHVDRTWVFSGENVARIVDENNDTVMTFNGFQNIRAGDGDDTFRFAANTVDSNGNTVLINAAVDGVLHGGDGNGFDSIDYSLLEQDVSVRVGEGEQTVIGIENYIGFDSTLAELPFERRLTVIHSSNNHRGDWLIRDDATDARSDGINDGSYSEIEGLANTVFTFDFVNFNRLVGGGGDDTFTFYDDATITGEIHGGDGGRNVIDADSQATPTSGRDLTAQLNGDIEGILNLQNIQSITANEGNTNTLIAGNVGASHTWTIDDDDSGNINGIEFANFANLTGSDAVADYFEFQGTAMVTGLIEGGSGAGDSVDLTGIADDNHVIVKVGDVVDDFFNIHNIEQIDANDDNVNQLIAANRANTWNISGSNAGNLEHTGNVQENTTIAFTGFSHLTGGMDADLFVLDGDDTVSGVLDGGAGDGSDELRLIGLNDNISVRLSNVISEGGNDAGALNAVRFESVNAAGSTNTLIAGDDQNLSTATTTWAIDTADAGHINNNSVNFSGFANLVGDGRDDRFNFEVGGTLSGYIDGGNQANEDVVDMRLLPTVSVTLGDGANSLRNIERVIGNNRNSTITADNITNTWTLLSGVNDGTINGLTFTDFNQLVGGSERDTFTISGGAVTGSIAGAGGNDIVNLTLPESATGELAFIGGDQNDTLIISGGNDNYSATYSPDVAGESRLVYSDTALNTYTVRYRTTETIQDNVVANSLTINGSANAETITLANNNVVVDGFAQVNYDNKNNLVLAGAADDTVTINGVVNVPGQLAIRNSVVAANDDAMVIANSILFNATGQVGSPDASLMLDTGNILVRSVNGDVYLENRDSVNIVELSTANVFDLVAAGQVSSNAALSSQGAVSILANNGNIELTNASNAFQGPLNLNAANNNITLVNNSATDLAGIVSQTLNVSSGGAIGSSGPLLVNGLATFDSDSDVTLDNSSNDFSSVSVLNANDVVIVDRNQLTLANFNDVDSVTTQSNGLIVNGVIQSANVAINAQSGTANLNNAINSTGAVSIEANGIAANDTINADSIFLSDSAGGVNLTGVLRTDGGEIQVNSDGSSIAQRDRISTSGGAITLNAASDIIMTGSAISASADGLIRYSAGGNIELTNLDAGEGTIALNSAGSVYDTQEGSADIIANRLEISSRTGISGTQALSNFETDVSELFVVNNGGNVQIINAGTVQIDRLRSNGDITLTNETGDIIFNNQPDNTYTSGETDALLAGGVSNANYDQGFIAITSNEGSILALGSADSSQPDIVGRGGRLLAIRGEIGAGNRPLVLHIRDSFFIHGFRSLTPFWSFGVAPPDFNDASTVKVDLLDLISLSGEQLVEVEELEEVSPAIFTAVTNYFYDDVSIRLPNDQLYDDELEELTALD